MALEKIDIEAAVIGENHEARAAELATLVRELIAASESALREDLRGLRITREGRSGFAFTFAGEGGREELVVPLDFEALDEHLDEYLDIVQQLSGGEGDEGVLRLEALDMAKKVVHDRAGRALKKALREARLDLEGGRRLFSLLVSLRVDTTRLEGVHGHRF